MKDWPERGYIGRIRPNTMLEATAFAMHYHEAKMGIRTLYWFLDPFQDKEYGLLLDKHTYEEIHFKDNQIWYPFQQSGHKSREVLEELFEGIFNDRIIFHYDWGQYGESPDPFVLIENAPLNPIEDFHQALIPTWKKAK